jgi:hypothetical protein
MNLVLRAPGTKCLKASCDELLSCCAINFNFCRYTKELKIAASDPYLCAAHQALELAAVGDVAR